MLFVYLHAPTALIEERMKARTHPYMNSGLLDSQLATLEVPSDAWSIAVDGTPGGSASKRFFPAARNGPAHDPEPENQ